MAQDPTPTDLANAAAAANVEKLEPGDVVQIDPAMLEVAFAGAFMTVTEVRSWGAVGWIALPTSRGLLPRRAYFRCESDRFKRIGRAAWIADE